MKILRMFLLAIALAVAPAFPLHAQVQDSLRIIIQGAPNQVAIRPVPMPITVGDTVPMSAVLLDADGDTLQAVYSWSSTAPTIFVIVPDPSTTQRVRGIALRKLTANDPPVYVRVYAEPFDTILVGGYLLGDAPSTIQVSEINWPEGSGRDAQFCAYFVRESTAVAQTMGNPPSPCPIIFPPVAPSHEVRALESLPPGLREPFAQYWLPPYRIAGR